MNRRARLPGAVAFMLLPAALVLGGLQVLRWQAMGKVLVSRLRDYRSLTEYLVDIGGFTPPLAAPAE